MKCGIVTVFNSENCGSFLQAYAMSCAIKNIGHDAAVVRQGFKGHSSTFRRYLKNVVKSLLKRNFHGAKLMKMRREAFRYACRTHMAVVEPSEKFDCLILGSDVIWDLTVPYFYSNREFFWGTAFGDAKVISYAPSLGFAKSKDLGDVSFVRDAISNMSSVSVRDKISKQILQLYSDKEIRLVCDPTYLIPREEYDAIAKPTELSKFIFLYCYGKLSESDKQAIKKLAQEEGLKTVTFGSTNPWCDISLAYDPLLFLSIYDKADYIITETFHGTVFATIYEKKFAVIKNDKPKVLDVLEMCAMSDKMTNTADDIPTILHSDFNYEITRQKIQKERENGLRYLQDALESCGKNG